MSKFEMYSPLRAWKKGDYPVSAFVHLSLGDHAQSDDGRILLSAQLMTNSEIDESIEQLMNELEKFRKAAKQELTTLHARMLAK